MIKEYRTVEQIVSPLMMVRQVEGVTYDELVEVELHDGSVRQGKVLEVNGDTAVVQLFDSAAGINLAQSKVRFLGHPQRLGVSADMLGRVFDGLGRPIDGGPEIIPEQRLDVNGAPMNPAARDTEDTPISGMPILNVDQARNVIICNYDLKPGYAGVENPIYARESGITLLLGDAADTLKQLLNGLKEIL